jgi:hypothetical protein
MQWEQVNTIVELPSLSVITTQIPYNAKHSCKITKEHTTKITVSIFTVCVQLCWHHVEVICIAHPTIRTQQHLLHSAWGYKEMCKRLFIVEFRFYYVALTDFRLFIYTNSVSCSVHWEKWLTSQVKAKGLQSKFMASKFYIQFSGVFTGFQLFLIYANKNSHGISEDLYYSMSLIIQFQ